MSSSNADLPPLVVSGGSPRTRGHQYGEQAASRIRRSIEIYSEAFSNAGLTEREALDLARRFMPEIEAYDPDSYEEMIGIAEGADLPVEKIVALNARTELLYWSLAKQQHSDSAQDECTGVVILPDGSADGALLHAQNWDWRAECSDSVIVLKSTFEDGHSILSFVEAGIICRAGLNSAGIGLTGNFLRSSTDFDRQGVPIPLIRRRILKAATLAEALGAVYNSRRSFSCNMMISQNDGVDGEAMSLEASPDEVFWQEPEGDFLVHANHFKSPAALAKVVDHSQLTTPDSLYRDVRLRRLLSRNEQRLSLGDLKTALADTFASPRAICRSPTAGPGGSTSATVASILMRPREGTMRVVMNPYKSSDEREYRLN